MLFSFRIICTAALLLSYCCSSSHSLLAVLDMFNRTLMEFDDRQSDFGPHIPSAGVWGHIATTEPENACGPVNPPPFAIDNSSIWIALIVRYPCQFDKKVLNAQQAGYGAVVVYNNGSDDLVTMHGNRRGITIPSVFVSGSTGLVLGQFSKRSNVTIVLWSSSDFSSLVYFIILGCIGGMGILLGICIVCVNWACQRARKRMSLLSKRKLKKLPVHKFKTGDPYETCAICLEEYVDGDKLRLLPCGHAYHCKCIDPWLTEKRNTCPLCKDVVGRRHGNTAAAATETQPLLHAQDDSENVGVTNTGFETIVDVHTVPASQRSYGAVNTSASPPAVVSDVVTNESDKEHDDDVSAVSDTVAAADDESMQHSTKTVLVPVDLPPPDQNTL